MNAHEIMDTIKDWISQWCVRFDIPNRKVNNVTLDRIQQRLASMDVGFTCSVRPRWTANTFNMSIWGYGGPIGETAVEVVIGVRIGRFMETFITVDFLTRAFVRWLEE